MVKFPSLLAALGLLLLPQVASALDPIQPAALPVAAATRLGWSALPGMVVSDEYGDAVALGDSIYAISYWQDPKRLLTRYTPGSFSWERVAEVPHGAFSAQVRLATIGGDLYLVNAGNLMRLDAATKSFIQLARQVPAHRSGDFAVAGTADRLYVIGGTANIGGTYRSIATVDVYVPATGGWASGPSLPVELTSQRAAVSGNDVYIVGFPVSSPNVATVYVLRSGAASWEKVTEFQPPSPLYAFAVRSQRLTFFYGDGVREHALGSGLWSDGPAPFCDIFNTRPVLDSRHSGMDYFPAVVGEDVYLFGGVFNSRFLRTCYGAHGAESLGGMLFVYGPDRDDDRLLDSHEQTLGSDIGLPDSDGDGYLDYQEMLANYSPTVPSRPVSRAAVSARLGKILLDVEGRGQLWYVDPVTSRRYAISSGDDIAALARSLGQGISERDAAALPGTARARSLAGRFFIHPERRGAVSYLDPRSLKLVQLTADAAGIQALARLATGVRQRDIAGIPAGAQAYVRFLPQVRNFLRSQESFWAAVRKVCSAVGIEGQSCSSTDLDAALWRFYSEEAARQ